MSLEAHLSHDSVIPMIMWHDKNLDPLDVKVYAITRGLSNKYGYCFATNEYLAESAGIGESSVRRSLAKLKNNGYLDIETNKNGIYWQRRIYISDRFKKSLRRATDEHPPAQNRAPPCSPVSTITNPNTNPNEEKKEKSNVGADATRLAELLLNTIKKRKPNLRQPKLDKWSQEMSKLIKDLKGDITRINRVLEWLPTSDFWYKVILSPKNLDKHFDQLELEMLENCNDVDVEKNKHLAQKVIESFPTDVSNNHIQLQSKGILFCYTGCWDEINFTDKGFKDRVLSRLSKMNLNTKGLSND